MSKLYKDPCSFSSSEHFRLNHVDLDWTVDFEQQTIVWIRDQKHHDLNDIVFLTKTANHTQSLSSA